MASKPVHLQAPRARVFCVFLPKDMERNLEKQVEEMYVQVMTTILLQYVFFSLEFPLALIL